MRIRKIRIKNIAGIEEFEIDPARNLNLIEGGNARGKSSILNAILSVVGGYDARLVRQGSDHGEVVLVLDDDTEIHKTIKADGGGTTRAWKPGSGAIRSPATHVKGLVDLISANPIYLLSARPQERVRALVRLLPAEVGESVAKQLSAAGLSVEGSESVLDLLDFAERVAMDRRRDAKSRLAASESNTKSVCDMIDEVRSEVAGSPEEIREKITALEEQSKEETARHTTRIEEVRAKLDAEVEEISSKLQQEKESLRKEQDERTEALMKGFRSGIESKVDELRSAIRGKTDEREKLMARVRELDHEITSAKKEIESEESSCESQLDAQLQKIRADYDQRMAFLSKRAEQATEATRMEKQRLFSEENTAHGSKMGNIQSELSELNSQQTICDRIKSLEEIKAKSIAKDAALGQEVEKEESLVAFVRSLREETVRDLGVDELSIVDGDIAIGGVPFPQLSHSERVSLAIRLASCKTGKLSVICVDGLEALDNETFDELRRQVEESDLQVFATKVGAGDRKWNCAPA